VVFEGRIAGEYDPGTATKNEIGLACLGSGTADD
jgi:hypothetical protein